MSLKIAIGACIGALMFATVAAAHGSITVTGSVVEVTERSIVIQTDDGLSQTVPLDWGIPIYDGQKLMQPTELKVGQRVSLDGYGDSTFDMEIQGVHLAVAQAATPAPAPR